jgi:hypothetical protein
MAPLSSVPSPCFSVGTKTIAPGMMSLLSAGTNATIGTLAGTQASGNDAFDRYRSDTLQRLEEEQKEFREFLSRLRAAKDKAEFDQFMTDRRNHAGSALLPTQS